VRLDPGIRVAEVLDETRIAGLEHRARREVCVQPIQRGAHLDIAAGLPGDDPLNAKLGDSASMSLRHSCGSQYARIT